MATYTHSHQDNLTELQRAGCQIFPQGISITLSIRELIRQGYLFSSLILMRPLIERAAIISYLCSKPESVSLWQNGWEHGKRPSLSEMMHTMGGGKVDLEETKKICAIHNHIVHGDPIGSFHNLIRLPKGGNAYSSSKMLDNPNLADEIAMEAQCYLIILSARMAQVFPEADIPKMNIECESGNEEIR